MWKSSIVKMFISRENLISLVGLLSLLCFFEISEAKRLQEVTCGSVLKLMNIAYKVRLHSHDIKYGSGSGQQSVTGSELKEDVNSMWAIKGTNKLPCKRGEPVQCGSKIQIEHLQTGRNLHSHLFSSPLSGQQEISAFGEDGRGDTGDVWVVICDGQTWERDDNVQFRHADTDVYLGSSGNTYGRPIHGQMEIVGMTRGDSTSYWTAMEGIFVHPTEEAKGPRFNLRTVLDDGRSSVGVEEEAFTVLQSSRSTICVQQKEKLNRENTVLVYCEHTWAWSWENRRLFANFFARSGDCIE